VKRDKKDWTTEIPKPCHPGAQRRIWFSKDFRESDSSLRSRMTTLKPSAF